MTQSLEIQVGDWLRQCSLKLVVAESCTGGLIGHRITNVPGSSEYYLGSITAYSYGFKQRLLGVCPETLLDHGFGGLLRLTLAGGPDMGWLNEPGTMRSSIWLEVGGGYHSIGRESCGGHCGGKEEAAVEHARPP